jgi:hypothetical protein
MIHLHKKTLRIVEFLVIGVLFGLIEDLIAVRAVSDVMITPRVIFIILAVAIPFAIVSELIVDHPRFWELIRLRRKGIGNDNPPKDI